MTKFEILTIVLSGIAIVISVVSIILSFIKMKAEKYQFIQTSLTNNLHDLNIKFFTACEQFEKLDSFIKAMNMLNVYVKEYDNREEIFEFCAKCNNCILNIYSIINMYPIKNISNNLLLKLSKYERYFKKISVLVYNSSKEELLSKFATLLSDCENLENDYFNEKYIFLENISEIINNCIKGSYSIKDFENLLK